VFFFFPALKQDEQKNGQSQKAQFLFCNGGPVHGNLHF
jgi:hypothetical protein